jgi:hypothetical protein
MSHNPKATIEIPLNLEHLLWHLQEAHILQDPQSQACQEDTEYFHL